MVTNYYNLFTHSADLNPLYKLGFRQTFQYVYHVFIGIKYPSLSRGVIYKFGLLDDYGTLGLIPLMRGIMNWIDTHVKNPYARGALKLVPGIVHYGLLIPIAIVAVVLSLPLTLLVYLGSRSAKEISDGFARARDERMNASKEQDTKLTAELRQGVNLADDNALKVGAAVLNKELKDLSGALKMVEQDTDDVARTGSKASSASISQLGGFTGITAGKNTGPSARGKEDSTAQMQQQFGDSKSQATPPPTGKQLRRKVAEKAKHVRPLPSESSSASSSSSVSNVSSSIRGANVKARENLTKTKELEHKSGEMEGHTKDFLAAATKLRQQQEGSPKPQPKEDAKVLKKDQSGGSGYPPPSSGRK